MAMAMLPAVGVRWWFDGLVVPGQVAMAAAAMGIVEGVFALVRGKRRVPGLLPAAMIYVLLLPAELPWWMVPLGAAFGALFAQEVFGGRGHQVFHPALAGKCFLAISYPLAASRGYLGLAGWAGAGAGEFDYLAGLEVNAWRAELLFFAAVGAPALLLMARRVLPWRVGLGAAGGAAGAALAMYAFGGSAGADAPCALTSGAILLGVTFAAGDGPTSPNLPAGRWLYGVGIGATCIVIRRLSAYDGGIVFAVLLGNLLAPTLDELAARWRLGRT
jgi:Na+-translocating ferredoxin:NAD+ oxidoreductase RnfD subunit